MAIEGTLDLFQLPDILQLISHQGKTGILTVQGEADIVAISFDRGRVVAADALNQTLEEALGEVLAGQGLVAPAEFSAVAAAHKAGDGRLMDLLVERRYIDRGQLLEALRLHTYRLLVELLTWRVGEFKFYSGDEVSYEEGFEPISVEELLIRSVEEAAGEGHPTIPDSRSIYEPVPPGRPIRVRREGEEAAGPGVDAVWLSPADKELLDKLDGGFNVTALVKRTGGDEYKVRYTLHRLLEAGVVRRRPPASAAPQVAPPVLLPAAAKAARAEKAEEEAEEAKEAEEVPAWRLAGIAPIWPGRVLAGVSLLVVLFAVVGAPLSPALPFPWQAGQRQALGREVRAAAFGRIDRAAKTYFLLEGRFPDTLGELAQRGLLGRAEIRDPLGERLKWSAQEAGYVLAAGSDEPGPPSGSTEAITGNLLLDPDFLGGAPVSKLPPLVLLD